MTLHFTTFSTSDLRVAAAAQCNALTSGWRRCERTGGVVLTWQAHATPSRAMPVGGAEQLSVLLRRHRELRAA